MSSPFNVIEQVNRTDSKIVVALERIAEAFRVLLWQEGKELGLSPIQIQLLIYLLYHAGEKSKVTYLALEFNLTKATVSDSIRVLIEKALVVKVQNDADSRSFSLALTPEGKKLAQKSSLFANALLAPINKLSVQQQDFLLLQLMNIMHGLNNAGVINVKRMCFNCRFHSRKGDDHYCNLLKQPLKTGDLRVDCPEHESIS